MRAPAWWEEHLLPRAVDLVLADRIVGGWRARACAGLAGEVLELGFGSGGNLDHLPVDVCRVLAVEPSAVGWERARHRMAAFPGEVSRAGADAAAVPLADDSADHALSTWTMCTIPDLDAALHEVRRVVRSGGALHFVEHSLAPTSGVARAQRLLQPAWGAVAGGCHLDRDIPARIDAAGLRLEALRTAYITPLAVGRPFGWFCLGRARVP